jgi:hypothetical protein
MNESPSHEAEIEARALDVLEKAESTPSVADHLEIVEDSPWSLTMRVHHRKYKTKVTIKDLAYPIILCITIVGVSITFSSLGIESFGNIFLVIAPIFGPFAFADIDNIFKRYTLTVDKVRGVMRITRYPAPFTRTLMLDHISNFSHISKFSEDPFPLFRVIVVLNDAHPANKKLSRPLGGYNSITLDHAVIARLNRALKQYRCHRDISSR